jgi:hypothetical protein
VSDRREIISSSGRFYVRDLMPRPKSINHLGVKYRAVQVRGGFIALIAAPYSSFTETTSMIKLPA